MSADGSMCKAVPSPVDRVVAAFGEARTAEIVGVSVHAVRKWRRKKATGGCGGLVPSDHQARLLATAQAEGKALTAADLIAEAY